VKIVRPEAIIICKLFSGKDHIGVVAGGEFTRHGQRRDDVPSGAAASD